MKALPVARAFNQFLNLANVAERYQLIHRREEGRPQPFESLVLPTLLTRLLEEGVTRNPGAADWPPRHRTGAHRSPD